MLALVVVLLLLLLLVDVVLMLVLVEVVLLLPLHPPAPPSLPPPSPPPPPPLTPPADAQHAASDVRDRLVRVLVRGHRVLVPAGGAQVDGQNRQLSLGEPMRSRCNFELFVRVC